MIHGHNIGTTGLYYCGTYPIMVGSVPTTTQKLMLRSCSTYSVHFVEYANIHIVSKKFNVSKCRLKCVDMLKIIVPKY